jgi:hypothetical protein
MTSPAPARSGPGSTPQRETRTTHDQSTPAAATGGAGPRLEPQLPHEVDQSVHSQASAAASQRVVGKQAYRDSVGPSRDTDRAPVTDALYNSAVAPDRGRSAPRK